MRFSLMRLLVSFDQFGYNFKLTYKGEDTYQTRLGGLCTFILKVITLIMMVVHAKSMIEMDDPKIISYARPLTREEKIKHKAINFAEEGFLVGFVSYVNEWPSLIPPEVGGIRATRILDRWGSHREELELKRIDQFMT